MSVEAITWALKQDIKPSGTKFVLVAIANCADGKEGIAWPSVAYLVDATGQDRKTVMAGINRLVATGYIRDTGERRGLTKQVIVYQLPEFSTFTPIQAQKRNSTENGTVPEFPSNSTGIPSKEYRNSPETVPKTGHGTVKNHQGTIKEPKVVSAPAPEGVSAEVWTDYLDHKTKLKTTVNATVLKTIIKELSLAADMGWAPDDALAEAMSAGWKGIKAAWLQNRNAGPAKMTATSARQTFAQQRAQAEIDAFVNGPADDKTIEMEVPRVGF